MERKKFNILSEEEKKLFIEKHFIYEIDMLIFSSNECLKYIPMLQTLEEKMQKGYKPTQKDEDDIKRNNMSLENFLMHGRNLFEFFYYFLYQVAM